MISTTHDEWHLTNRLNGVRVQVAVFIRPPSEESTAGDELHQTLWESLFYFSS